MARYPRSSIKSLDDSNVHNFPQHQHFVRSSLQRSSSLPRRPTPLTWEQFQSSPKSGLPNQNGLIGEKLSPGKRISNGYVAFEFEASERFGKPAGGTIQPATVKNTDGRQRLPLSSRNELNNHRVYPVMKNEAHTYKLPPSYPTYKRQSAMRPGTRMVNMNRSEATPNCAGDTQKMKLGKGGDSSGQQALSPAVASPRLVSRLGMFGQISEINDHVYLSGVQPLRPDKIRQKKISSIVNATIDEPSIYIPGIDCLKVRIDDSPYAHLDAYFDLVADRIKAEKEAGGKVLVHCVAGVSRSTSLVLAYLMKHEGLPLREAYWRVKAVRSIIRPNIGFWRQLIKYEQRLFGRNSVKFVASKWGDEVPDVYTEELKGYSHTLQTSATADKSLRSKPNPDHSLKNRRAPERIIPISIDAQHFKSTGTRPLSRSHAGSPLASIQPT